MIKLSLFIFCLVCLLPPMAFAEGNPVPFSPVPFAIMGPPYSHIHQNSDALEKGEKTLQLLELTGARWTRQDFWWSVVQPDKDTWSWDYFDQAIDSYRQHRINLLQIGQAPVYLEGMQDQVVSAANLQVECAVEAVALGDRARLNIIARNPFPYPLELTPGIGFGKEPSDYYHAILWQ